MTWLRRWKRAFPLHLDAEIILGFPGPVVQLGARVLAEIGDDRNRCADARGLKPYSGPSPTTRASGRLYHCLQHAGASMRSLPSRPSLPRWLYSSPRRLHRRPHPRSEALPRGCVVPPVPQNGPLYDLEPFRGDKARDGLLTARVRCEGDENRRFRTKLTSDSHQLLARRHSEDRIVKHRRAADEGRTVEDQLQAVVVGEIMSGRQTELTGVPGDDVPVPPGSLRELDAGVLACPVHPQPPYRSSRPTGYTGTHHSEPDFLHA